MYQRQTELVYVFWLSWLIRQSLSSLVFFPPFIIAADSSASHLVPSSASSLTCLVPNREQLNSRIMYWHTRQIGHHVNFLGNRVTNQREGRDLRIKCINKNLMSDISGSLYAHPLTHYGDVSFSITVLVFNGFIFLWVGTQGILWVFPQLSFSLSVFSFYFQNVGLLQNSDKWRM